MMNPALPSGKSGMNPSLLRHPEKGGMKCLEGKTLAIVDVETSGTSATFERIIEIGILRIEDGVCVETYKTCVNPGRGISPWISSLTGILPEEVEAAPPFEDVIDEVERLLDGAIFVAHNVRFDYAFIKNEFKRVGRTFRARCLCTVRLSRALEKRARKHDLSSIIERYGFSCLARHRAFDDAQVLWDLIRHFHTKSAARFQEAFDELLKTHRLPQGLKAEELEDLPEGPGVYIFYGEKDEPLYVGKSVNIRNRVLSHFSGDYLSSKELVIGREVRRIETRETAGELSALLLESSLVKSMHPAYNRMLRKRRELVIARRSRYGEYASIGLERVEGIGAGEHKDVLGIFKSLAQGKEFLSKAAKEHSLCKRVLGLEKPARPGTKGECFSLQLGICRGACKGSEEPGLYNERFEKAFETRRIASWPYAGPVLIEERVDDIEKHSFVLDNWCLIADAETREDGLEFRLTGQGASVPEFDYDRYKIFSRYIREPLNRKHIRPLKREEVEQFLSLEHEEPVIA